MPSLVRDVEVTNLLAGQRFLIEWTLNSISESITTYSIFRSTAEQSGYSLLAQVPSPVTQYVDKVPFTFGVTFFYKVIAVDASGTSSDLTQTPGVADVTFDNFEETPFPATNVTFSSFVINEVPSGAVDGVNATFQTAAVFRSKSVEVFVNGIHRLATDFQENADQKSFTFIAAPALNSKLQVNYIKA